MLGACPQIMAVLGSLILYALGKYLSVRRAGNPRQDLGEGEFIFKQLSQPADGFLPLTARSQPPPWVCKGGLDRVTLCMCSKR